MYNVLLQGFPGKILRGWLGWSSAVLVRASSLVLYDTGNWGDRPGLFAALKSAGVAPADVETIVLSHLHFDHVGNVECFPNAEILVHSAEVAHFEHSASSDPAIPYYQVKTMLSERMVELLTGDRGDVLPGLRWIHTPGHTPGHISLLYTPEGYDGRDDSASANSTTAFAGDAIKHRRELLSGAQEQAWDVNKSASSIARLRASASTIVPGHDATLLYNVAHTATSAAKSAATSTTTSTTTRTVASTTTNAATGATVLPVGTARETLTFTTDGRQVSLEV